MSTTSKFNILQNTNKAMKYFDRKMLKFPFDAKTNNCETMCANDTVLRYLCNTY